MDKLKDVVYAYLPSGKAERELINWIALDYSLLLVIFILSLKIII